MQENHLSKWIDQELTEAELKEFKASEGYATYEKIKAVSDRLSAPDFDTDQAFAAIRQRTAPVAETKVFSLRPYTRFLKVAAAIVLLISGAFVYLNSLNTHIATQFAENKTITLPDNSNVILNAGSQLSYDEDQWDTERNLTLSGEAFFKVAKGKKFTVATDAGTVTVLGTQFNVVQREGYFKVSCYEGLVSVSIAGEETRLPAGKTLTIIRGAVSAASVTKNGKPSWIDKESTFQSVPLRFVLDEFERQHNVEVVTKAIDLDKVYTGTFSNDNTELALKSISIPSQIKFKFEGNKVLFYAQNTP
ncbi:FecR family protein [Maribacter sp. 2-571]|uniref:FecR family protein n=1 Tax=Maribacter sp. 2-571 TaxID=3417569 RepID=UPI003D32E6D6